MTDIEMEFLFGETFAPMPVAGKSATGRGAAVSRSALQLRRGTHVEKQKADKKKIEKTIGRQGAVDRFAKDDDREVRSQPPVGDYVRNYVHMQKCTHEMTANFNILSVR